MCFEKLTILSLASAFAIASASGSFAQSSLEPDCQISPGSFKQDCFCEDEANETLYEDEYDEYCLALPGSDEITNFVPLITPLFGLGALAAAAGGGGSTNSTTSTTSTGSN